MQKNSTIRNTLHFTFDLTLFYNNKCHLPGTLIETFLNYLSSFSECVK